MEGYTMAKAGYVAVKAHVKPRTNDNDPVSKKGYYACWIILKTCDEGSIHSAYCTCNGGRGTPAPVYLPLPMDFQIPEPGVFFNKLKDLQPSACALRAIHDCSSSSRPPPPLKCATPTEKAQHFGRRFEDKARDMFIKAHRFEHRFVSFQGSRLHGIEHPGQTDTFRSLSETELEPRSRRCRNGSIALPELSSNWFTNGHQHSPSRVVRIGVFADYTKLSIRARLTLSGACPRRNSSRGIIGPGVTKYLKLMSDDDIF
ncbi:hypothetical protein DPMN_007408 [Dreissena polymorpha]|uniref:Uncharacterized protein n=1 Tax=Dreissena polymorpha TaxID=45954 RepID=A0A9D4MWZ1_DREPO|nr:hypothetical protein DPMN_007408 [Dreissena polymorpha]